MLSSTPLVKRFKFGKNAPVREMKTLHFENYGTATGIPFPPKKAWERNISTDPLGNDLVGDCAEAAPGHAIQNLSMVAHAGSPTQVTREQVVKAYSDITGYNPDDQSTDQGSNMLDVCKYLKKTGIAGVTFDGYVALNPQNIDQIHAACFVFGWVYFGISVPVGLANLLNSGQEPPANWNFKELGGKPSGEGHALAMFGYGRFGKQFNSWGTGYHMDNDFWLANVDEAYALVSSLWIKQNGRSPSGFDYQGLLNDLTLV